MTSSDPALNSWAAFSSAFLDAWAPADERHQSVQRFLALRQASSVAEYNADYFSLARQAGYDESPLLRDIYLVHLKPEIYKALEQERRVVERWAPVSSKQSPFPRRPRRLT